MVEVSRLNGEAFVINSLLIETIEANPDTVISLTTGHKHVVRETIEQVIERVVRYNAQVQAAIKLIQREEV